MHELTHMPSEAWSQIDDAIMWLWLIVACGILLAGSILFGRAMLPSLLETRDIAQRARSIIPLFYVTGAIAIIGLIFVAIQFADNAEIVYDFFPEVWY